MAKIESITFRSAPGERVKGNELHEVFHPEMIRDQITRPHSRFNGELAPVIFLNKRAEAAEENA